MIITIDGPVASGKSSAARLLAERLGYYYLQTGLLYRVLAYLLFHKKIGHTLHNTTDLITLSSYDQNLHKKILDEFAVPFNKNGEKEVAQEIKKLSYQYTQEKEPVIFYNGLDLTGLLADHELAQYASRISAQPVVRELLLPLQRTIGKTYNLVADGRDCGSVVFPDAAIKFYMTADLKTRAQRLQKDTARSAHQKTIEELMIGIQERDKRDQERKTAPLIIPQGAIVINNSGYTLEETVAHLYALVIRAEHAV